MNLDMRRKFAMSKNIFITGTGTDVGKTYVTGLIVKKFRENNKKTAYYKAAMSGNDRRSDGSLIPGDALQVKNMSGIEQPLEEMCPYIYETAVSPHLTSKIEGNPIEMEQVLNGFDNACSKYDYITAEGSGGILCPLRFDEQKIQLEDFIKARDLSCLMIADAGLGTINAVVLTAEYMKAHKIPVKGIIFNHYETGNQLHKDNLFMCEYMTGLKVVACVKDGDTDLAIPFEVDYCFFSDSGSVAVEVALKIALQYYMNREETQRTMVLALEHAYHGDTFKTMEVGDDEDYHFVLKAYGKSKTVIHIPTEIKTLEQAFAEYHDRLNCFIVEPLLQGAGGMRMYDISFLQRARELCDQYDVLLIFDEVATGFGRTGNRFVADLVLPDILVLGKALTGGYIGHAVTVTNRKVYDGFYDDNPSHALMHGPTFMGNALACSVALKSIELFETQDYMSKIRRIEEITRREMEGFSDPRIKEIRIMGACVCIEVYDSDTIKGYQQFAYDRGVFSRPFLNYMYAMVPYVIKEEELVKVLNTMKEWFCRSLFS